MSGFKEAARLVAALDGLYVLMWLFGSHGRTYTLEPAKQETGAWVCRAGEDGPFEENSKGAQPVCHVPERQRPSLWFPYASVVPCPYKDPLGGPKTTNMFLNK